MSFTKTWNTTNDWSTWTNLNSTGEIRSYNNTLNLPFNRVGHYGITNSNVIELCRYRFGQKQTSNSYGQVAFLPLVLSSNIAIEENGAVISGRSDYMYPRYGTGNVFDFPKFSFRAYLSFWFKSSTTDYSTRVYLAGYHKNILSSVNDPELKVCSELTSGSGGNFSYSVVIDKDKKIKAICRDNVSSSDMDFCISPCCGDVEIDTEWHHVVLLIGKSNIFASPASSQVLLIVDNNYCDTPTTVQDTAPIGSSLNFRIGNRYSGTDYSFLGTVDELVVSNWIGSDSSQSFGLIPQDFNKSYRFIPNIFVSPVVDTTSFNNRISSIKAIFNNSGNSDIRFSFRASNDSFLASDASPEWTGFNLPNQIISESIYDLDSLGFTAKGRYIQIRVLMIPSDDDLKTQSPTLSELEIISSPEIILLKPSNSSFELGNIIGQTVDFVGTKNIHKVTLDLSLHSKNIYTSFISSSTSVAFQAANFQENRNAWVFQPDFHWIGGWKTSGISIRNYLQPRSYTTSTDAVNNAPYLTYKISLLDSGVYDLWGYGYTSGSGFFWSFDNDITNLRTAQLSDIGHTPFPRWTKFGTIYVNEGGTYDFTVYMGENQTIIFDQWLITKNDFSETLNSIGDDGYNTPLSCSVGPFCSALRLRRIDGGNVISLSNYDDAYGEPTITFGQDAITSWLSSNKMIGSGKYNYEIRSNINSSGVQFENGLSLEFFQIGGDMSFYSSWNYSLTDNSHGTVFRSSDFGQTYY